MANHERKMGDRNGATVQKIAGHKTNSRRPIAENCSKEKKTAEQIGRNHELANQIKKDSTNIKYEAQ